MSFFSKIFSKQTKKTANHEDSYEGKISKMSYDSYQNNNDISSNRTSYLLVIAGYHSHKDAKNWGINEIKDNVTSADLNGKHINLADTTETHKDQICNKFRANIWGCGASYVKDDKNHKNPIRHLIFGTKEDLRSNAGYKEKFKYFYKIGMIKNQSENKSILNEVNFMKPEEYLKQFPEKEVTFGRELNTISDKTWVMFIGPRSFDLYTYSEFVDNIYEGLPLRIMGIYTSDY